MMDEETGRLSSIQETSFNNDQQNTSSTSLVAPSDEQQRSQDEEQIIHDVDNVVVDEEDEEEVIFQPELEEEPLEKMSDEFSPTDEEKQHRLYISTTEEETVTSQSTPTNNVNSTITPTGFVVGGSAGKPISNMKFNSPAPTPPYIMSDASRCFDINGKGYLDSTERSLRKLDKDNDGQLTARQMYDLMKSLREEQQRSQQLMESFQKEHKKANHLKYGIVALVFFAVLLSLANIGTAFVAARLAKDTSVDSQTADLVDKETERRVGVTEKQIEFQARPLTHNDRRLYRRLQQNIVETRRRMLQQESNSTTTTRTLSDAPPPDDDDDGEIGEADDYDLSCSNAFTLRRNGGPTKTRVCAADAAIDFAGAFEIYRSFCPSWRPVSRNATVDPQPPNECPSINGRVNNLYLVCNRRTNRLLDANFPMGGPFEYGDANTLFPGIDDAYQISMYTAEQVAFDPTQRPPMCFQKYLLGMACLDPDEGNVCILHRVLLPPYCPWYDPSNKNKRKFTVCGGGNNF